MLWRIERGDTSEEISLFSALLSDYLTAKITQIVSKFRILDCKLLVKSFLLAKTSCEHVDFFAKLIIFKLIFVSFSSDILITFLPKLLELAMLGLLERFDHVIRLVKLLPQISDDTILIVLDVLGILLQAIHETAQSLILITETRCFPLSCDRELSLPLEILIDDLELLFVVAVFAVNLDMVVHDLLVICSQLLELFLSSLASSLHSQQSLLLESKAVLILIACKAPSVNIKVLILVLPLILALEALKVLNVLLLKTQFEILELCDFLLIVVNSLSHAIFLTFDDDKLHLNSLLGI